MDADYLGDRNAKAIRDARQVLRRYGGLDGIISEGIIKETYGEVHSGRGFTDFFVEYEPTYYRRDTALARDYVWYDRNPVIVFMPHWKESEAGFEKYTGLGLQAFVTQVREGYVIPTFGHAEEYEDNPFFQRLFDEWERELPDKDPLFANALEKALMLEDDVVQEQLGGISEEEVAEVEFWKAEAEYLCEEYDGLREVEEVKPTEALKQRDPVRFFAERRFMLRTAGYDRIVSLLDSFLDEFDRATESVAAREFLQDAVTFTFFAHMVYSAPIYYSMGGGNTHSKDDHEAGLRFITGLKQQRQDRSFALRAAERIFTPISTYLVSRDEPLSLRMPTSEGAREQLLGDNDVRTEREKFTAQKAELQESLVRWQYGESDRSEVRDDANELYEGIESYVGEIEREIGAPNEVADVVFDVGARALSHMPTEPLDDPLTIGLEALSTLEEVGATDTVNMRWLQRRREKQLGEAGPVSASSINNINVWQVESSE